MAIFALRTKRTTKNTHLQPNQSLITQTNNTSLNTTTKSKPQTKKLKHQNQPSNPSKPPTARLQRRISRSRCNSAKAMPYGETFKKYGVHLKSHFKKSLKGKFLGFPWFSMVFPLILSGRLKIQNSTTANCSSCLFVAFCLNFAQPFFDGKLPNQTKPGPKLWL